MGQSMKFVAAIVRPIRLEDVLETLGGIGIHSVTVSETKDYGQRGPTEIYRGLHYAPKFLPMFKIEAAVPSDRVESVTAAIVRAAKTGQGDDGKIFVFDLEHQTHMRIGTVAKASDELPPRQAA